MLDDIYESRGPVLFKGQLFSAPMNWADLREQLKVLAAHVRITIASGLVDLNRLPRQATVRRNIVVQLIRMRRDARHPDYVGVDMQGVQSRAKLLATTDEPTVPSGPVQFLEGEDDIAGELFSGMD